MVWVASTATRGFRHVWVPGGEAGWLLDDDLLLAPPVPAVPAPVAPAPPAPSREDAGRPRPTDV